MNIIDYSKGCRKILQSQYFLRAPTEAGVCLMCEPASHASHASHASQSASHASHAKGKNNK